MGMDIATARHLDLRLGFGSTPAGLSRLQRQEPDVAIQIRVENVKAAPGQPWVSWVDDPRPGLPKDEAGRLDELQRWWLREMLRSESTLGEKVVLFWHGHFGVRAAQVDDARLVARYHRLIREHAVGNFKALLLAVLREPAVLLQLKANQSDQAIPATALAQALLTRYALPAGACSQAELGDAARALTGWHLQEDTLKWKFVPARHDGGQKTFLGRTGALDGAGLLEILLEDDRVAEHIAASLWRAFVSPQPPPEQVTFLGAALRDADYELGPLLAALLACKEFLDPRSHGVLARSPVELVVGLARTFYLTDVDAQEWLLSMQALGQDLLAPPQEGPWPQGAAWFYPGALERRQQILRSALRGPRPGGRAVIPDHQALVRWLGRPNLDPQRAWRRAREVLLGAEPLAPLPQGVDAHGMVLHAVLDPQFQLK
jgi:uncharacterized protein (DUF1800 family)